MAATVRLRFRDDLPDHLEERLINRCGFRVYARKRYEYLIVEKVPPYTCFEALVNGELPEHIQLALRKRMNNVISLYVDPDANEMEIRGRLERIAQTLPTFQRKFVRQWIDDNVGKYGE
jgi:hypothetical protein